MKDAAAPARYRPLSIGLHWLTLVLLAAVYASMELSDVFPKGSDGRAWMKSLHYVLGLSVLAFVFLRLPLAMTRAAPLITPAPPRWQMRLAGTVQVALYLFMLAMPVAGWLILSARGSPISLFGFVLPGLIGEDAALARSTKEVHEAGATLGYLLVGLHATAALVHHYGFRDNTLRRMLPGGR